MHVAAVKTRIWGTWTTRNTERNQLRWPIVSWEFYTPRGIVFIWSDQDETTLNSRYHNLQKRPKTKHRMAVSLCSSYLSSLSNLSRGGHSYISELILIVEFEHDFLSFSNITTLKQKENIRYQAVVARPLVTFASFFACTNCLLSGHFVNLAGSQKFSFFSTPFNFW